MQEYKAFGELRPRTHTERWTWLEAPSPDPILSVRCIFLLFQSRHLAYNTACLGTRHLNPSVARAVRRLTATANRLRPSRLAIFRVMANSVSVKCDVVHAQRGQSALTDTHGTTAADSVFVTRQWNAIVQSYYIAIELPSQKLDLDREIREITASEPAGT